MARKNPLFKKPVYLELWGSPLFAIRQKIVSPETTEGTIFLLGPLDFEKQSMYHLSVLALVSRIKLMLNLAFKMNFVSLEMLILKSF